MYVLDSNVRARVSSSFFFLLFMSLRCAPGYSVPETSCATDPSMISLVEGVTVRYINKSAVSITWNPVTDNSDYTIEGYTVHYSSVAVDRVRTRCSGSVFFNNSEESTSYGVIGDLNEDYDGFEFTVLIETENGTFGEVTDVTPVIGLRNDDRSHTMDTTTVTGQDSPGRAVPVETIVTVVVCIVGTFVLYTCVLIIIVCCYRKSQTQIKRLKKEVMAVNELDFPNPGIIGDASEYKVTPLYPLDTIVNSSDRQSSAAADVERESVFADKGGSSAE